MFFSKNVHQKSESEFVFTKASLLDLNFHSECIFVHLKKKVETNFAKFEKQKFSQYFTVIFNCTDADGARDQRRKSNI